MDRGQAVHGHAGKRPGHARAGCARVALCMQRCVCRGQAGGQARRFMDMLTSDMTTLASTRRALRVARRSSARYARMVGSPASASPSDEYTGEREMESRRLISRTDACARPGGHTVARVCRRACAQHQVHRQAAGLLSWRLDVARQCNAQPRRALPMGSCCCLSAHGRGRAASP